MIVVRGKLGIVWIFEYNIGKRCVYYVGLLMRIFVGVRVYFGVLGLYDWNGGEKKDWMLGRYYMVFNWVVGVECVLM